MANKNRGLIAFLFVAGLAAPALADDANQPGLLSFNFASALWVLGSFVVLLIILYKAAWKNVLESLKAREGRIRGDIQHAEDLRKKAEDTLKEYSARLASAEAQVRDLLAKAAADAEKTAANIRATAQAEGEAERQRTRKEIEFAQRDAVRQVYAQAAEISTKIAEKIIGRNLTASDQQDLVEQALGQVEHMSK